MGKKSVNHTMLQRINNALMRLIVVFLNSHRHVRSRDVLRGLLAAFPLVCGMHRQRQRASGRHSTMLYAGSFGTAPLSWRFTGWTLGCLMLELSSCDGGCSDVRKDAVALYLVDDRYIHWSSLHCMNDAHVTTKLTHLHLPARALF